MIEFGEKWIRQRARARAALEKAQTKQQPAVAGEKQKVRNEGQHRMAMTGKAAMHGTLLTHRGGPAVAGNGSAVAEKGFMVARHGLKVAGAGTLGLRARRR